MRSRQPLSTSYLLFGAFGPRAEPNETENTCRTVRTTKFRVMLPTTDLDGSNVDLFYIDSPQHGRACMGLYGNAKEGPA